ncbi:HEAT repeat domain-containing protein [Ekhidna sp.]
METIYTGDLSALVISVLTGVFLSLSFVFFLLIVFKKIVRFKEELIRTKYWVKIQDHLAHILIQSAMNDQSEDEYRRDFRILKKSIRRSSLIKQWILDEMIKQISNLSGEAHSTLMRIYSDLDLKSFSMKKLKSRNWYKISKGIQELEQMKQHDSFTYFYKFLNARNKDLRKAARMGLTALAPQPLSFLDHLKEELTGWEQMNIATRLKGKDKDQLPDFSQHYYHPQPSVASFCVQMSIQFGCYDHIPLLITLLESANPDLQSKIIHGLTELGAFQASEAIYKVVFSAKDANKEVLIASLQFLSEMGSDQDKSIVDQMIIHEDVEVRMEAVNTALKLGFDFNHLTDELKQMTLHHQNELIS